MKRHMLLSILLIFSLFLAACATPPAATTVPEAEKPQATEAPAAETKAPEAPAATEAPVAETTEPEAPAATEAAVQECPVDGKLKIGMIQPMSGAAATMGGRITDAAKMAVEEINAAGGILGCEVELVIEDSQADAAVAVSAAEKLLSQDLVQAIIGAYHSHTTLAVMPLLDDAKVPMLEIIATSPKITDENNGWMYRISSTNPLDAQIAVRDCWDELGAKKWAFLPVNNDWGKSVPVGYQVVVDELGGTSEMVEPLEQGGTNFLSQLTKLRASDVDTVAVTTDVESLSVLAKQVYEAGMRDQFNWIATSGNSIEQFQQLLKDTPEAAEGWKFVAYYRPDFMPGGDTPQNTAFTQKITEKYPDAPADYPTAQGYQAVYLIKEAIEAAGKYDGVAIRDALAQIEYEGLNGPITFDDKGQAAVAVHFQEIRDGERVMVQCK